MSFSVVGSVNHLVAEHAASLADEQVLPLRDLAPA